MTVNLAADEPQQRAIAAAEALDAEGQRVTARAVKDRARVQMETARVAAADWNTRKAQDASIPTTPASLTLRFTAIWAEAYRAARGLFETEREGWIARLDAAEGELEALQADIDAAEQERDQARGMRARHDEIEEELRQTVVDMDRTQIRTQSTLEAITAERDRLRSDLADERDRHALAEAQLHRAVLDLLASKGGQTGDHTTQEAQ